MKARLYLADARSMQELENESVQLIITSPPYWHIKDYGVKGQIGYGQSLHEYLRDLYRVFSECYRVLEKGSRFCINIGDQFARSVVYGKYKVIPIHAEVISMCEEIGFDYMGAIIWQKKTTMNTTGGAVIMGSFPYPPNGIIEIDYEFILIFKKEGKRKVPKDKKELSVLSKEEWKEYFSGHWKFGGAKQVEHEAVFPEELPKRLIKMFSFVGDRVLDPFAGSGTTLKSALELGREAIGYEINPEFVELIKRKVETLNLKIIERKEKPRFPEVNYQPRIKDAKPIIEEKKLRFGTQKFYKVVEVISEKELLLDTGLVVRLLGLEVPKSKAKEAIEYLNRYVKGKQVFLKFEAGKDFYHNTSVDAYVYLKNKIFINKKMLEMGLAEVDTEKEFSYKNKFMEVSKIG
ncbi:MAG: DNA methyltransferase [Thermocrinis sp.]|jgi:DNA modification methylase|uniref:DNA methyltransferase n=1 Tax=Thermocrinis sp. TaxID=2024383 RepID=UPI003C00849E